MDPLFELALLVKAVDRELQRRSNESLASLGVTAPQADAIVVIGQAGRISLKDLGDLLIAEGGHPSRLVDRLVEAGFVEREQAEDDRRRIDLSLTVAGKRMQARIAKARQDLADFGRQIIPQKDIDAGLKVLRRLVPLTPHAELIERRRALEAHAGSGKKT